MTNKIKRPLRLPTLVGEGSAAHVQVMTATGEAVKIRPVDFVRLVARESVSLNWTINRTGKHGVTVRVRHNGRMRSVARLVMRIDHDPQTELKPHPGTDRLDLRPEGWTATVRRGEMRSGSKPSRKVVKRSAEFHAWRLRKNAKEGTAEVIMDADYRSLISPDPKDRTPAGKALMRMRMTHAETERSLERTRQILAQWACDVTIPENP